LFDWGKVPDPSTELLEAITSAYRDAMLLQTTWNGRDFYVSFGEDARRNWDDAKIYGFVAAGGGAWYSKSLQQLKPGHRVFTYIPKGSGVGGYVAVGEVTGEAMLAKDFEVHQNGAARPYLDVAQAPDLGRIETILFSPSGLYRCAGLRRAIGPMRSRTRTSSQTRTAP
jgi:hypothetical protein